VAGAPDLERDAGGVQWSCWGGAVWMGTATAPAAQAPQGPDWVCGSHGNLPSTVVIIVVRVRDELRDNHHVRPRTSVNPAGCPNRSNLLKCAGQGTIVVASGRRGRGFKSRHPDSKTPGHGHS
jgi:hypothetical protein